MAQGKAFTKEERESIIESLRPFLEIGLSRNKACESIGLDPTTLSKWVQDSEVLSMKLKGWENTMNMLAIANINSALQKEAEAEDARKETSKWYLERRMKAEFSTRTENTGPDGAPLTVTFSDAFKKK
jgi:hypothetical protein